MGKVVTSDGLQAFVTEGKVETIAAPQAPTQSPPPQPANPPESSPPQEGHPTTAAAGEASAPPEVTEELAKEFSPEELKAIGERVTRTVGKKHREMREAKQEASEATEWGRQQWREKVEIERERDALRTQLEQAAQQQQRQQPPPKEPELSDFIRPDGQTDWVKYVDAKAEWKARLAVQQDRQQREEQVRQAAIAKQEAETAARFQSAKARYPDFEKVMQGAKDVPIQVSVLQYLREAELGPDLTYHLIKHPDEVKRIQGLTAVQAIAEVAKLEASIRGENKGSNGATAPAAEKPNGAAPPPPITPLQASGAEAVATDPAKMSFKQLREYERQRQAKNRR